MMTVEATAGMLDGVRGEIVDDGDEEVVVLWGILDGPVEYPRDEFPPEQGGGEGEGV